MENQNSVVYVGKIGSLSEILGADNIELVTVGGWNAITKKGEYKVDDLVVVATTDAVIPQKLSDDLGVTNYLRKGQRVRTVKLRGVYSECLIMSLSQVFKSNMSVDGFVEGQDMMEVLGITKYEPPAKVITLVSGERKMKYHQNPNFHIYYKFPNQKNVPDMFNEEDMLL
jgi:RNA ligase (TIGR02306 family)